MILKISINKYNNGTIIVNRIFELPLKKVKPSFSTQIRHFPYIQIFRQKLFANYTYNGFKLTYLFNTECSVGNDNIKNMLKEISKPYLREKIINDIIYN